MPVAFENAPSSMVPGQIIFISNDPFSGWFGFIQTGQQRL